MGYKLVWVPVEKAKRENIPFSIDDGKIVYMLPSTLTFGHLELNGVEVTGYFKPEDDDTQYVCRPWRVAEVTAPETNEPDEQEEAE